MARILIVEDELALRRVLTLNLARRGYSVAEADSVVTATEACAASPGPFDLILLDINLPDQTGWDVLRQLEECGPSASEGSVTGTPGGALYKSGPLVIVMTAVRPQQSRLDEFQPAAVLLKPFPISALLQLIQRVLEHTPAEQSADDDTGDTGETSEASEDSELHRTGA